MWIIAVPLTSGELKLYPCGHRVRRAVAQSQDVHERSVIEYI